MIQVHPVWAKKLFWCTWRFSGTKLNRLKQKMLSAMFLVRYTRKSRKKIETATRHRCFISTFDDLLTSETPETYHFSTGFHCLIKSRPSAHFFYRSTGTRGRSQWSHTTRSPTNPPAKCNTIDTLFESNSLSFFSVASSFCTTRVYLSVSPFVGDCRVSNSPDSRSQSAWPRHIQPHNANPRSRPM